ncbi:hypothetical protein [Ramlibacter sp. PS4R-6]|uniref:hypothetical protein n=1 Tax=Ramlibacter sp. PS4R-6 TaxID=3133438 RepID=UPI0030A842FB
MKYAYITAVALAAMAFAAQAQTKIYRCGNTYTNSEAEAKAKGCKPLDGGNITVVEGLKPNGATRVATAPTQANGGPRVDSEEQKQRDNDARAILEAELKKAETRQAELVKEYNNGEPEKLGPEHKNHQKYVERTAELKASIARNENDIAGLKRELARINRQ